MTRPIHPSSCVWIMTFPGKAGVRPLAWLLCIVHWGYLHFQSLVSPLKRGPIRFYFCPVASDESRVDINANSFHLTMCPVVSMLQAQQAEQEHTEEKPHLILSDRFLAVSWLVLTYTHMHAHTCTQHMHTLAHTDTHSTVATEPPGPTPHTSPSSRHLWNLVMPPLYAFVFSPGVAWWSLHTSNAQRNWKKKKNSLRSGSVG